MIDAVGEFDLAAFYSEHDVAFRVIAANRVPDQATIARFRVRHESASAELFGEVHANTSEYATRDHEQIAAEILAEADAVDRAEESRPTAERWS